MRLAVRFSDTPGLRIGQDHRRQWKVAIRHSKIRIFYAPGNFWSTWERKKAGIELKLQKIFLLQRGLGSSAAAGGVMAINELHRLENGTLHLCCSGYQAADGAYHADNVAL